MWRAAPSRISSAIASPVAGAFSMPCTQSIGRDLSNTARAGDPRGAAAGCEIAEGAPRQACMRGVVFALVDNTWNGRYAFPFCASFASDPDRDSCFRQGIDYLKSLFGKSAADVVKDCEAHAADSRRCVKLASG